MSIQPRAVNRWTLALALAGVVVLSGVGAFAARSVYQGSAGGSGSVVLPSDAGSIPSSGEPGDGAVRLTADANAYPLRDPVRQLLQTYFDAINAQRYDTWRTVVTAIRLPDEPRQKWLTDYQSTRDGSIVVYRIDVAPQGGLRVLLSFTSTQNVADAPPDFRHTCIRWHVVWPLSFEDGTWKVDAGSTGKTPQRQQC